MGPKAAVPPGDHGHDEVWSPGPPVHQGHAHLRPSKLRNLFWKRQKMNIAENDSGER